jgi:hypothetical protein
MPAPTDIPPITEMSQMAAEIFETYGPLAACYAMLYQNCLEKGLTVHLSEAFVLRVMDAMR